ncbi:MAG: glycoside hydrolase family 20 protein [Dysgonamonadaceae bacterium]|jgi:hexosaminidase|nr:glycoside hydrolase family 20 protein [Dysgonamonadaceae bacterium]
MKKIGQFMMTLAAAGLLFSCNGSGTKEAIVANYQIVPLPQEVTTTEGTPFGLSSSTKIVYPEGNEKMQQNAEFLTEFLQNATGVKTATTTTATDENAIILELGLENENPEAYRLTVDDKTIHITGSSEAGVFYGIQTLRKATPIGKKIKVSYPQATINDQPRFGYRGMHLDVARHFQSAEFVKKFIDMLALHNINTFHWHLTEDQGWRIEIKKYPKLTEIGSKRSETVIGRNSGEYDGTPHGGFYTQEEIKEIVAYAQKRFITIVPEVDLPGHMLAALAAYPELGCTGGPYEVEKNWGVFDDVLCAGKEETYTFLEDVLTEVIDLFPSKYIHIGGDECPKTRWEECPDCQKRIKELGLKDGEHKKEFYLQSYVTARIEKFLNDKGRSIIGWDEILEGELAPNATVMSWRGMGGGIKAAQMGHDVIMTPTNFCYFDYYQTNDTKNEPLAIGGYLPIEVVYNFEPAPDDLTEEQKSHILGPQANLWTEYVKTSEHVEYMTMPRIAALSEVQWSNPEKKNYNDFLSRLPGLIKIYDQMGYNYAKHVFNVQVTLTPNNDTNALDVEMTTIDNAPIYYTLDGTEPTEKSIKYEGKFNIKENATLTAAAFRDGKSGPLFSESVTVNKSTFKPITLLSKPDDNYTYTGASLLSDGLKGKEANYRTGRWIGFSGKDLVAVIDLLEPAEISSLQLQTCVNTGDWVFDASQIVVETSDDNVKFKPAGKLDIVDAHKDHWYEISGHTVNLEPVNARYFKITVKPTVMPEWHPGKGKTAYVFVDEIALN